MNLWYSNLNRSRYCDRYFMVGRPLVFFFLISIIENRFLNSSQYTFPSEDMSSIVMKKYNRPDDDHLVRRCDTLYMVRMSAHAIYWQLIKP